MSDLEKYFDQFRKNIIGIDTCFTTPYGVKKILYADWVASGRLYAPIEDRLRNELGPFVANTHSESSFTGSVMTLGYKHAHKHIKEHVNAGKDDVIITSGFGMTAVVNKLQRILGLRGCGGRFKNCSKELNRPVIFITHMEHHSNQTSWYETIADVIQLKPTDDLHVNPDELRAQLELYADRPMKIGAFTACSNVTGIHTPYHKLAAIMHEYGGLCFVDFAASAPYEKIDMHPGDPSEKLDAVYFSPHKFLGGPGSSGVIVFDSRIYHAEAPDDPGGGTVDWTNPWGKYKYVDDIEAREDGGTPGFLEAIRASMAISLKEKMKVENIVIREKELLNIALPGLRKIPGIKILADNDLDRLGIISFYHDKIHFNLMVKLLNDRFGIQVRGGCACAGTYGHYLLEVSYEKSLEITSKINNGDLSEKPGWVRWSLHPTTTNTEAEFFLNAVNEIVENFREWEKDYMYLKNRNEFVHITDVNNEREAELVSGWFNL